MAVGCALLTYEEIPLAKEVGFDYIEFMGKYLVSLSERDYQKSLQMLDKDRITCQGLNAYCPQEIVIAGPGFDLENARRYARKCAARSKELSVRNIGIGSPNSRNLPKGFPRKEARQQLIDFLKITAEEFGKYNINVCLEALATCYCNYINTFQEAIDVIKSINWENIKAILDFYNMEHMKEADMNLEEYIRYIGHGHISDDDGAPNRRFFLKEDKTCIHQARIRHLYSCGYKGAMSVEVDLPIHRELAGRSLAIIRQAMKGG